MTVLGKRDWVPQLCETLVQKIANDTAKLSSAEVSARVDKLVEHNRTIHERECFNLNPATNVMNPKAEALLSSGLGSRPSLGYPGDKYEMGLEAIEEIEVICAQLCAEIFGAKFAEIRVGSGALANLYAFMATCKPGDAVIVPPGSVGGHVTHHEAGCAGLYGLDIHESPVNPDGYSVDLDGLAEMAKSVHPKLITIGGSLNLFSHPVDEIKQIADTCGARVLFDAAHQCGIIAGKAWPNPLEQGADLMTMSTYKSLGGPAGGLVVTNDADLAERLDRIAFPGMTANFDAAKSAALAITMLDWRDHGEAYAAAMVDLSKNLAQELINLGVPVFKTSKGMTSSHQFALEAKSWGGGQTASKTLRGAGFLASGIGLPIEPVAGDMNGLRFGTPELVRWGVQSSDAPRMAKLILSGLSGKGSKRLVAEVMDWRSSFSELQFINN